MAKAIAYANNDVAQVAWRYDAKIPDCLGFAIYRKEGSPDGAGAWTPLPAWVGFKGQSNKAWTRNTTEIWPIQKFEWKDVSAERGKTYSYKIVPTKGQPSTTQPLLRMDDQALIAGPVTLTPRRGSFESYFNRGILSTQAVSHQVPAGPSGTPNFQILTSRIDQPGDPLRLALAGQMIEALESLLKLAASTGGSCYLALYELNDPDLIKLLLGTPNLHIILSNTGPTDAENHPARQSLHAMAGIEVFDRFVGSQSIGHNKFCVYVDTAGDAQAVLTGSTNWTCTALCAQSNNSLIVHDRVVAKAYLDYWQQLRADTPAEGTSPQGPALRAYDAVVRADTDIDAGHLRLWFSPNTPAVRRRPTPPDEVCPPDLSEVFSLMDSAQQAILFLEFEPGSPSVVDHAATVQNRKPDLFVRGAVTDPRAVGVFNTTLVHRPGEPVAEVAAASAITDQFAFWQQELLKSSPQAHAIIHDKIVVIDPFTDHCVVVTGSHNNGYKASYDNDENLVIIKGHRELAAAYAVHVMDVYDHYRFRYLIQKNGVLAFSGLSMDDTWQDRYFDPADPASQDGRLWF